MNRNILLFVCCLSAGILVVHFHQRAASPAAPSERTANQPVNNAPVTPSASADVVAETVSVQTERDPILAAGTETALINSPAVDEKAGKDKYELLRELSAWAARDPEAAMAAAMDLPDTDERKEALAAVCFGLAQVDPAAAVAIAQDLHLDEQPGAIMGDLVQQWATIDVASSLAWATVQPAGASRDDYTTRIAFILSQTAPSEAAALVIEQIPPGPAQDEAIMTVLHQWANQNMIAAAHWAGGVPAGPLQDRVANELNGILDYQRALGQP